MRLAMWTLWVLGFVAVAGIPPIQASAPASASPHIRRLVVLIVGSSAVSGPLRLVIASARMKDAQRGRLGQAPRGSVRPARSLKQAVKGIRDTMPDRRPGAPRIGARRTRACLPWWAPMGRAYSVSGRRIASTRCAGRLPA